MKRDIYAYITTVTLVIAFGFSAFLIYSDNVIPFTTQATIKTTSVEVIPEVKGYINAIYVKEGQSVVEGTPLFQLDSQEYELAQQKSAAAFLEAQSRWTKTKQYLNRISTLRQSASISKETLDEAQADESAARAAFLSSEADLNMAKLNLERTQIKAKERGVVTNLTFTKGMYATTNTAVIHLVKKDTQWIEVDFTEKGLNALKPLPVVNIVYDAIPNQVFRGKIVSIDQAISSGLNTTSQLGEIASETRWIRPQQKIRVRVIPDSPPETLVAGSRASVMVRDTSNISDSWMTLLSWLRFIY
jgi:RND family efflux transporter MFP subunit